MEKMFFKATEDLLGRRALSFVNLCNEFTRISIGIVHDERMANAKSLLGVLSLHIMKGDEFLIEVENGNHHKVFERIQSFFNEEE